MAELMRWMRNATNANKLNITATYIFSHSSFGNALSSSGLFTSKCYFHHFVRYNLAIADTDAVTSQSKSIQTHTYTAIVRLKNEFSIKIQLNLNKNSIKTQLLYLQQKKEFIYLYRNRLKLALEWSQQQWRRRQYQQQTTNSNKMPMDERKNRLNLIVNKFIDLNSHICHSHTHTQTYI